MICLNAEKFSAAQRNSTFINSRDFTMNAQNAMYSILKKRFLVAIVIVFLAELHSAGTLHASEWNYIEGRWAKVEFHAPYRTLADSLLQIAELAIPRLAKMHGLPATAFTHQKVRIILSDAPDISNGFAIDHSVVIYARSSMYMPFWTGRDNWYKTVLTHELAHYVTFRKIRRKLNWFGELANLTVPRWWYEGIAQYFAEQWNAYRGDIYIKNAVLSGRLNYDALKNLKNGRLLYASANAFVRYLASTYGDSSLIKVMSYKEQGWYLNFADAFKAVYKHTADEVFREFIRHMVLYYGSMLAAYPEIHGAQKLPSFGYRDFQVFVLDRPNFLVAAQLDKAHHYKTAFIGYFKKGHFSVSEVISDQLAGDLILSADNRYIAYARPDYSVEDNQLGLKFRWYVYDRWHKISRVIAKGIRARYGAFTQDNQLLLVQILPQESQLLLFSSGKSVPDTLWRSSMSIGRIMQAPDGSFIFDGQNAQGNRNLFQLKNGQLSALTKDSTDDRHALALNDSLLVFNQYQNEHPALAIYNLKTRQSRLAYFAQDAVFLGSIHQGQKQVIFSATNTQGKLTFYALDMDTLLQSDSLTLPAYRYSKYARWTRHHPQPVNLINLPDTSLGSVAVHKKRCPQFPMMQIATIVLPTYDKALGAGFYGTTTWMEALRRQMFSASFIFFPQDLKNSLVAVQHTLRMFNQTWTGAYYHGPVFLLNDNGRYFNLYQDLGGVQWLGNFFIAGNSRLRLRPQTGYLYTHAFFDESDAGAAQAVDFHGVQAALYFDYLLPTRYYPVLPKRQAGIGGFAFHSFDKQYDFTTLGVDVKLATNLLREDAGIKTRAVYMTQTGFIPPFKQVGVDRFFEFDLPRDYTYTLPVRGVRQDIYGASLLWASTELTYFWKEHSGYKLIFIPLNNVAFSVFADWAQVRASSVSTVYSYGLQTSFGDNGLRFGAGYARTYANQESFFMRVSLNLPEF